LRCRAVWFSLAMFMTGVAWEAAFVQKLTWI
jgi:hypothetical protein